MKASGGEVRGISPRHAELRKPPIDPRPAQRSPAGLAPDMRRSDMRPAARQLIGVTYERIGSHLSIAEGLTFNAQFLLISSSADTTDFESNASAQTPHIAAEWLAVMPSADASGEPIGLADAFDVPVFVRHSSSLEPGTRPRKSRVDRAWQPWPGTRRAPRTGTYLVPTTWREVLDAALTVGRDPLPWLTAMPGLASAEIIARRAPLAAYLHRTISAAAPLGGTGYQLEPNAVYREGTEKTARAMFGYRIGMTMAEWACRGLMGLGPTIHAEATTPPGYGPMWSPKNGQPDLVGYHWQFPETWLIEAKGNRHGPGEFVLCEVTRLLPVSDVSV